MKLRNKKTGKVGKITSYDAYKGIFAVDCDGETEYYYTLAKLNEEWEDYKPKEPLIKDEKIRKAVRIWAEANDYEFIHHIRYNFCEELEVISFDNGTNAVIIEFNGFPDGMNGLEQGEHYTIEDLCGEEEE